jgi:TonB family protein
LPPRYRIRFRPSGETVRAEPTYVVPPDIPQEALSEIRKAPTVVVEVAISEAGRSEVRLVRGCGDRIIEEAALLAFRQWRWKPAMKDGLPVKSIQKFTYDLEKRARFYD